MKLWYSVVSSTSWQIMETQIEKLEISDARDWAIERIKVLTKQNMKSSSMALYAEFYEWIEISEDADEIEYISIVRDSN